jgi:transcriptional repressor NrdR
VRFASVYRSFRDINEFMNELRELADQSKEGVRPKPQPGKGGQPS